MVDTCIMMTCQPWIASMVTYPLPASSPARRFVPPSDEQPGQHSLLITPTAGLWIISCQVFMTNSVLVSAVPIICNMQGRISTFLKFSKVLKSQSRIYMAADSPLIQQSHNTYCIATVHAITLKN